MILDVDVKKEEFQQALANFQIDCDEIPKVLDEYLNHVAKTGIPVFEWPLICPFLQCKLEHVARQLVNDNNNTNNNFDEIVFQTCLQSLKQRMTHLNGIPFTIQRICELLVNVKLCYHKVDKFFRGFSKLIMVVSSVDADGNKLSSVDERFFPLVSRENSINNDYTPPPPPSSGTFLNNQSGGIRRKWPTINVSSSSPTTNAVFSPPSSPPSNAAAASTTTTAGVSLSNEDNDLISHFSSTTRSPSSYATNNAAGRLNGHDQRRRMTGSPSSALSTNANLLTFPYGLGKSDDKEEEDDDEDLNILIRKHSSEFSSSSSPTMKLSSSPGRDNLISQSSSFGVNKDEMDHEDDAEIRPIGRLEEIVENVPAVVAAANVGLLSPSSSSAAVVASVSNNATTKTSHLLNVDDVDEEEEETMLSNESKGKPEEESSPSQSSSSLKRHSSNDNDNQASSLDDNKTETTTTTADEDISTPSPMKRLRLDSENEEENVQNNEKEADSKNCSNINNNLNIQEKMESEEECNDNEEKKIGDDEEEDSEDNLMSTSS